MTQVRMNQVRWPALILTVIAVAYAIVWWIAADRYEAIVQGWIDARIAKGDRITIGEMSTGGFPGTVRITLRQAKIQHDDATSPIELSADALMLSAQPWRPFEFDVTAESGIIFAIEPTASKVGFRLTTGEMHNALRLGFDGQLEQLNTQVQAIKAEEVLPSGSMPGMRPLATIEGVIAKLELGAAADPGDATVSAQTDLKFTGVVPANLSDLPMEGPAEVMIRAKLHGTIGNAGMEDLIHWRDAGGVVEIVDMKVNWLPLDLSGSGTLALDAGLQPLLAASLDARGLEAMVDRLVAKRRLKRGQATVVKLAMAAMTRPAKDSGAPVVRVPLTLQNQRLKAGPLVVAKFSKIAW
jgi:hypothetical protein